MPPSTPSPERKPSRTLLVCEPSPFWTPELQRRLRAEDLRIRGCQSARDVADEACEAVVMAWHGDDPAVPGKIRQLRSTSPCTPIIVVVPERLMAAEWAIFDLGATVVMEETCGGERLAAVVGRALGPTRHQSGPALPLLLPAHTR